MVFIIMEETSIQKSKRIKQQNVDMYLKNNSGVENFNKLKIGIVL